MKILDRISMSDVIESHFGYNDYQGKWYETYDAKIEGCVWLQTHPYPIGNGTWDWLTMGYLTEGDEEE